MASAEPRYRGGGRGGGRRRRRRRSRRRRRRRTSKVKSRNPHQTWRGKCTARLGQTAPIYLPTTEVSKRGRPAVCCCTRRLEIELNSKLWPNVQPTKLGPDAQLWWGLHFLSGAPRRVKINLNKIDPPLRTCPEPHVRTSRCLYRVILRPSLAFLVATLIFLHCERTG